VNNTIQQIIDSGGPVITLPPGEFKGPFYIKYPCVVEGNNTTLWNNRETVLFIESDGVTLKNLRVELINSEDKTYSVCSSAYTMTENVEIIGRTSGFGEEDCVPYMTKQLHLGKFRADTENTFVFEVYSAGDSSLCTDVKDIELEPTVLKNGINKVKLTVSPLSTGTLLYGDIIIRSRFSRRFYINGRASDSAEIIRDKSISHIDENIIYKPDPVEAVVSTNKKQTIRSAAPRTPIDNVQEKIPVPQGVHILTRGERISIDRYASAPMKVYMGYRALFKQIDIDPYAFMLDSSGVTSCDDDFVFFGNTDTQCGALFFNSDKSIDIDLRRVPEHIKRISFVYSIYQPDHNDNFSKVMDPYISIMQKNSEIVRYTASELFAETTIIFLEMYRHNTEWKLNTIGQGYREGLKRLCANYGLIVS